MALNLHTVRKAASRIGLVADPDDKDHVREEKGLVKALREAGIAEEPSLLSRSTVGVLELFNGPDMDGDGALRKQLISDTAHKVAKQRGEELNTGFFKDKVIPNSEPAQKHYREYLTKILDEKRSEAESPDHREKVTAQKHRNAAARDGL